MAIPTFIIGVLLCILGYLLHSIGFIFQKIAHNKLLQYNKISNTKKTGYIESKIWLLGISLFVLGSIVNSISLRFIPQSVLLPLSSIILLFNTVLSVLILQESFNILTILAILIILISATLITLFGPKNDVTDITSDYIKDRLDSPYFNYILIALSIIAVIVFIRIKYDEFMDRYVYKNSKQELLLDYNDSTKNGATVTTVNTVTRFKLRFSLNNKYYLFVLLSYTYLSSFISSIAYIFLKCFVQIISNNIKQAIKQALTYLVLSIFIILLICVEYFRQKALKLFNNLYVIPLFQCQLIIYGTTLGGLFFDEIQSLSDWHRLIFFIGIFCIIIGVTILTSSSILIKKYKKGESISIENDLKSTINWFSSKKSISKIHHESSM